MKRLTKDQAISLFGTRSIDLANGLQYCRSAISSWPDLLTVKQTRIVLGAALLAGKKIPKDFLK